MAGMALFVSAAAAAVAAKAVTSREECECFAVAYLVVEFAVSALFELSLTAVAAKAT